MRAFFGMDLTQPEFKEGWQMFDGMEILQAT